MGDRDLKSSLAFYGTFVLFAGEVVASILGAPSNYLLIAITGAILLGILFGPDFPIEFFRALRGTRQSDDRGGREDA